ncbi:YceI family protein [Pseudophaeobacter leonis]|uniref:YceI family protein n=1 Tax=Pseudophaeobacter leonis TaxID=1144477 RepID=UPI0009F577E9|nr:YceI family protein [Pseudophaeobacter leonis]
MLSRRQFLLGLTGFTGITGLATTPAALWAANTGYALDLDATKVGFEFCINGLWQTGSMPIASSSIDLNPNRLEATKVSVTLNAGAAKTGFILATRAMTGPEVLDVARFPTISFTSRRILLGPQGRLSGGAQITGDLTLRGVTRPITLEAELYRPTGSAPEDLSQLDFNLSGSLSRAAFGASGFPGLVKDTVRLTIRASIRQVE